MRSPAIRALARNVLPRDAWGMLSDAVGRARLSAVPRKTFDPSNLRRSDDLSLPAIWNDQEIARAWQHDDARVFSAWPSGRGAVNRGDCRAIYYLIAALKPRQVLEIGTNIGSSTIYFATALQSHSAPPSRVTTVDILDANGLEGPWRRAGLDHPPIHFMREFGLGDMVEFICSPALEYLARAPAFDLIFLDGSHAHDDVYREVAAAVELLNPGGVILLHDYYPGGRRLFAETMALMGPYRALERYRSEGAGCTVLPFGQLPWPTRPGSTTHMSSLALLLRRAGD